MERPSNFTLFSFFFVKNALVRYLPDFFLEWNDKNNFKNIVRRTMD